MNRICLNMIVRNEEARIQREADARVAEANKRAAEFATKSPNPQHYAIERIEREKAMSGLTPTERAAKEEAEQYKAKLAEYEERQRQQEEAEIVDQAQTQLEASGQLQQHLPLQQLQPKSLTQLTHSLTLTSLF